MVALKLLIYVIATAWAAIVIHQMELAGMTVAERGLVVLFWLIHSGMELIQTLNQRGLESINRLLEKQNPEDGEVLRNLRESNRPRNTLLSLTATMALPVMVGYVLMAVDIDTGGKAVGFWSVLYLLAAAYAILMLYNATKLHLDIRKQRLELESFDEGSPKIRKD